MTITMDHKKSTPKSVEGERLGEYVERRIPKTVWAIQRMEPGNKMTCFGRLPRQSGRCGAYINAGVENDKDEVPAPFFWGRRKHPGGLVGDLFGSVTHHLLTLGRLMRTMLLA